MATRWIRRWTAAPIWLAAVTLASGCSTRISTTHVSTPQAVLKDEGIHYYLPRTVVRVSIPVTETTTKAAPYADLTRLFFPFVDEKRILSDSTAYSIDPSTITFVARGVRDPDHHYVVKPTGDWWANTVFKFSLGSDGVVNKLDITIENRSVDLTLTAIEAAAGIASKVATSGVAATVDAPKVEKAPPPPPDCPYYSGTNADMNQRQRDKFLTLVPRYRTLYCHLFPEDRDAVFAAGFLDVLLKYVEPELTPPSGLRGAEGMKKVRKFRSARALVEELDSLQSSNAGLLNQLAPNSSVEVWRAIQEARAARIKEILGQFFGAKSTDPAYAVATFDIDPASSTSINLFELSADTGICDVFATTLVASIPRADCKNAKKKETVAVAIAQTSIVMAAAPPTPGATTKPGATTTPGATTGIRYRIPGRGTLVLTQAQEELGRAWVDIAQFGSVASLPRRTGGLKTQYTVELDPATGALRDITVGNQGVLTNEAITRAGKVAESVIDTRRALNPPPPAAPTAQELAEKERKLKEEQLRIRLLDECLQDPAKAGCAELIKPQ